MRLGEPVDARIPWLRKLHDLDQAWAHQSHGTRLKAVLRSAETVGDSLRSGPRVVSVRTLPLTTLVYPTKYAFSGACRVPMPFVVMTHRALLVQVRAEGELKNVLFNPTNFETSIEAPFFRKLADQYGEWLAKSVLTKAFGSVEEQLAKLGLMPEDIDVIAFDHFHVQDLRPLLGVRGVLGQRDVEGLYPRALLLAPRAEWEDWDDLHPFQRAWFVRDGKKGVPNERVVLTDSDLLLGDGAYLLRTPGHTSGNQTLFANADGGVFGCSENGTCADNWSPMESKIPGLREMARLQDLDVILNSNTPEAGCTQYTSMMLERTMVDRAADNPAFVRMFSSSEVTASRLALGIKPSYSFGEIRSGHITFAASKGKRSEIAAE